MVYTFSVNKNCTLLQIVQSPEQKLEKPSTKTAERGNKNCGRKYKKPGTLHNVEQGKRGIKEPPSD